MYKMPGTSNTPHCYKRQFTFHEPSPGRQERLVRCVGFTVDTKEVRSQVIVCENMQLTYINSFRFSWGWFSWAYVVPAVVITVHIRQVQARLRSWLLEPSLLLRKHVQFQRLLQESRTQRALVCGHIEPLLALRRTLTHLSSTTCIF